MSVGFRTAYLKTQPGLAWSSGSILGPQLLWGHECWFGVQVTVLNLHLRLVLAVPTFPKSPDASGPAFLTCSVGGNSSLQGSEVQERRGKRRSLCKTTFAYAAGHLRWGSGASVLARGGDFYTTGRQRKLRGRGGDRAGSGHTLLHPKPGKATRPTLPATMGISWKTWQIISARVPETRADLSRPDCLPATRYRLASFPQGQSRGVGANLCPLVTQLKDSSFCSPVWTGKTNESQGGRY